jgi:hypothetical protein
MGDIDEMLLCEFFELPLNTFSMVKRAYLELPVTDIMKINLFHSLRESKLKQKLNVTHHSGSDNRSTDFACDDHNHLGVGLQTKGSISKPSGVKIAPSLGQMSPRSLLERLSDFNEEQIDGLDHTQIRREALEYVNQHPTRIFNYFLHRQFKDHLIVNEHYKGTTTVYYGNNGDQAVALSQDCTLHWRKTIIDGKTCNSSNMYVEFKEDNTTKKLNIMECQLHDNDRSNFAFRFYFRTLEYLRNIDKVINLILLGKFEHPYPMWIRVDAKRCTEVQQRKEIDKTVDIMIHFFENTAIE